MAQVSSKEKVSIIFRALNEEKWFAQALEACRDQDADDFEIEIILVDSGSTDRTIGIAERFGCRIIHIQKSDFTFGRSLNLGCAAATGDYLAIISAHCIPASDTWLKELLQPLRERLCDYTYGRQIGHDVTRFSEHQVFLQYYPPQKETARNQVFVNNANAALRRETWQNFKFDEEVTGLEDMVLGKAIVEAGGAIEYVPSASVIHIHEETLSQIKRRYFREALTLKEIYPAIQFRFGDFLRYTTLGIVNDLNAARRDGKFLRSFADVIAFRVMQYWGTYRGHNQHRALSREQKERYYYPKSARRDSDESSFQSQNAPVEKSLSKG